MRTIIHSDDKTGEQINYGDKVKISLLTGEFADRKIIKEYIYSPIVKAEYENLISCNATPIIEKIKV